MPDLLVGKEGVVEGEDSPLEVRNFWARGEGARSFWLEDVRKDLVSGL